MLNSIAIQGRLVHTPEAKVTKSGKDVCTFSIACDRQSGGQKETDFFNCTEMVINTFVRKEYGMTFEQLKAEHSAQLKANIMSNLINLSETNATVAIFLAKSVCGLNENYNAPANEDAETAFAGALRKASRLIGNSKDLVSVPDRLDDDAEEED